MVSATESLPRTSESYRELALEREEKEWCLGCHLYEPTPLKHWSGRIAGIASIVPFLIVLVLGSL